MLKEHIGSLQAYLYARHLFQFHQTPWYRNQRDLIRHVVLSDELGFRLQVTCGLSGWTLLRNGDLAIKQPVRLRSGWIRGRADGY
jgi:hypothetical protein